ncbi:MAG TPA: hypothetical protein VJ306_05760 [Pyrinomonadaceae bacterium]|jgi:hypothetical protein|nr:hypothetical protein [Pyrinomonadaceae bacterium]
MLAYVFWHWPRPDIERGQYLDHLTAFHRTLAANKPPGFQRSVVFRIHGANWLKTNGEAYEEWYLLDDSAAMDPLNDAAVSGVCEEPHNRVAREAADGTGGLYRLRAGAGDLADAKFATWLSKPTGVSYKDFYARLEPGVTLWGRQMTLGPTREFCIHSHTPIQASDSHELTRIYPLPSASSVFNSISSGQ